MIRLLKSSIDSILRKNRKVDVAKARQIIIYTEHLNKKYHEIRIREVESIINLIHQINKAFTNPPKDHIHLVNKISHHLENIKSIDIEQLRINQEAQYFNLSLRRLSRQKENELIEYNQKIIREKKFLIHRFNQELGGLIQYKILDYVYLEELIKRYLEEGEESIRTESYHLQKLRKRHLSEHQMLNYLQVKESEFNKRKVE